MHTLEKKVLVMTEPLAVLRWASPLPDIQDDHPRDTG